jgi:hypothetical protein
MFLGVNLVQAARIESDCMRPKQYKLPDYDGGLLGLHLLTGCVISAACSPTVVSPGGRDVRGKQPSPGVRNANICTAHKMSFVRTLLNHPRPGSLSPRAKFVRTGRQTGR